MSFLDRLKREADQQRLQAEQTAREREERETRYRTQIEPKMKALTQYLEGLCATLQEVRPPIVIRMAIQGYGDLCTVPFWDYKVEPERRHRSYLITMTWSLRVDPERTPVVRADGVTRVKALTNVFRQHMLAGIKEEKRTPQGEISLATFHARGYVKAKFTAQISADDPVLRLVFENASWLGSSRRQVNWDQVDDPLFDRIGRFIVREDDSLFTEELTDELKQRLRKDPGAPQESPAPTVPAPAPPQAIPPIGSAPAVPAAAPPSPAASAQAAPPAAGEPPLSELQSSFIPGMIPAPAPVTEGEVIEIDESKLGLDQWQDSEEDSFGAFSFGKPKPAPAPPAAAPAPAAAAPSTVPQPAAPAPAPPPVAQAPAPQRVSPAPVPPVAAPKPAPPPAAPAPAAAAAPRPATSPVAPPTQTPPPATPAAPAPVAVSAAAPAVAPVSSAPAAAPQAPARTPAAAASAPAAAATTAPALPSANVAAPAASPAAAAGDAKSPADEESEREAALFRLKVRAMLARMRTDEPGTGAS